MCLNLARAFALHWKVYLICDFCGNLLCKLSFWCFCGTLVLYISRSKISNLTGTWRHMRQGGYSSGVNILWKYQLSSLQWCCNISITIFGERYCDVWFCNSANAIYFKAIFTQPFWKCFMLCSLHDQTSFILVECLDSKRLDATEGWL